MRDPLPVVLLTLTLAAGCGDPRSARDAGAPEAGATEIAHFPLEEGDLPEGRDATFDAATSRDGNGSLRVDAERAGRFRLYALDGIDPRGGRLVFTGFLRARELEGTTFLELRCRPATGDPSFARGIATPVRGTTEWTPHVVGFSRPDRCVGPASIELNAVIDGRGTVWIDDLRLWSVAVE